MSEYRQTVSILPKGTSFSRYLQALARTKNIFEAGHYAERVWRDSPEVAMVLKAEVQPLTAGTTSPFIAFGLGREVLELVQQQSIVGRLTPLLRHVPFTSTLAKEVTGSSFAWVGENSPAAAISLSFSGASVERTRLGGLIQLSGELLRTSGGAAEAAVRADVARGIAKAIDINFLDPALTASLTVRPASITNGGIVRTSSGSTASTILADLQYMSATLASRGAARWLMSSKTCCYLAALTNSTGNLAFPNTNLTDTGGVLIGIPVIASENIVTLGIIALVDVDDIALADEGGIEIQISRQASIVATSTPGSSPAAAELVPLWQRGLESFRINREIGWKRSHDTSVVYMSVSF